MARIFLSSGVLAFALCLGCNQSPPAENPPEAAHEEHGHDHAHEGHAHEGHDHAAGEHAHDEHAHGDASKTYAEAVEKVEAARDSIRDNLAAGEKDKADAALHELGHVLERIPELAKEASLSPEEQEAAKKDANDLLDLFGTIDEQIHGNLEITYDAVSEKIDAAVTRLHERIEVKK